jgi:hypothetical protein
MTSFEMTLLFESHTLWLSTCKNFILMKCIVARYLIFIQYKSCYVLMKWLELCDMESTPNCWDHTDDCNIGKGKVLYMSIYSIHMSSGYHYFAFFIRNPKWIFEFMGFWNHLMCSKDFGN